MYSNKYLTVGAVTILTAILFSGCTSELKPIPQAYYSTDYVDTTPHETITHLQKKYIDTEEEPTVPVSRQKRKLKKEVSKALRDVKDYSKKLHDLEKRKEAAKARKLKKVKKVKKTKVIKKETRTSNGNVILQKYL
jgi:FtsZ-interacting cell division protein ZipA